MATGINDLRGVIHGKTIELVDDCGLPEGQPVRVTVQPVTAEPNARACATGLAASFGAWADDSQALDEYLDWNRQRRKVGRPEIEP
jgi:hypothetical protein